MATRISVPRMLGMAIEHELVPADATVDSEMGYARWEEGGLPRALGFWRGRYYGEFAWNLVVKDPAYGNPSHEGGSFATVTIEEQGSERLDWGASGPSWPSSITEARVVLASLAEILPEARSLIPGRIELAHALLNLKEATTRIGDRLSVVRYQGQEWRVLSALLIARDMQDRELERAVLEILDSGVEVFVDNTTTQPLLAAVKAAAANLSKVTGRKVSI